MLGAGYIILQAGWFVLWFSVIWLVRALLSIFGIHWNPRVRWSAIGVSMDTSGHDTDDIDYNDDDVFEGGGGTFGGAGASGSWDDEDDGGFDSDDDYDFDDDDD